MRLASETHAASEDEECEGVEGAEDAKTHVKTHLRADEAAAGTQPQEPRQPERMRRERMKPDDMGALVRAVAYLNIADRRLLCSASTALLQRSAAAEALTDGLGPVSAAGAPGTGGADKCNMPQMVANVAWAAAVIGDVDASVHTWLATCLHGAPLLELSAEQVCCCCVSNVFLMCSQRICHTEPQTPRHANPAPFCSLRQCA